MKKKEAEKRIEISCHEAELTVDEEVWNILKEKNYKKIVGKLAKD